MKYIIVSFLLFQFGQMHSQSIFNIKDFGAVGDNKTVNTKAINEAIKTCSLAGGGEVYVPPGTYITGSIRLQSNVNLHLDQGAYVKGSKNIEDYRIDGIIKGLMFAFEEKNIAITGLGKIDGNSDVFFDFTKKHEYVGFDRKMTRQGEANLPEKVPLFSDGPVFYEQRPDFMIVLLRCEQIKIKDVTFLNSPNWAFRIGDSDGVQIEGIKIYNNLMVPNSDGIHCTTSRNVIISNCDIRAGDDPIAITGFGDETGVGGRMNNLRPDYATRTVGNKVGKCENIVVSNCILRTRSSGVRVGYGDNDIRNITFQNLIIFDSNRGIGIFNRDRANIENIQFNNITIQTRLHTGNWWGKAEPIHISSIPQDPDIPVGYIKNISFSNIRAISEAGIVIYASEGNIIEGISLSNVDLSVKKGTLSDSWGGNFDLRPAYPMEKQQFEHDIPGLSITNVSDMIIRDFSLEWTGEPADFYTHGIEIKESKDIRIFNFKGNAAQKELVPIKYENDKNISIE